MRRRAAPKKRESRSERLARRETRGDSPPTTAPARAEKTARKGIVYTGLLGGLLGCAALIVVTIGFALSDDRTEFALLFGPLSVLFLPAAAVSVVDRPERDVVLRLTTALALVVGLGGFAVDPGVPFIMAPPTVLLATGTGLLFQGRRS